MSEPPTVPPSSPSGPPAREPSAALRPADEATGGGAGAEVLPAATVVVVRDGAQGIEVLMLRRSASLAFAAGAWVFPGGRVDPEDADPERPDDAAAAARRAAAREAQEEAGLRLDPQELVPVSRWMPPPEAVRLFDTWFFAAAAPPGEVVVDGGEIDLHEWARPTEVMALRDAGRIELVPPTWLTLHHLAGFPDAGTALAALRAQPPRSWVTRLVLDGRGERRACVWAPDAAFESGDLGAPGPRNRLLVEEAVWRYERSGGW
jgi:8-oxo-dGTP pyrophosphatase MutT (NUDIX family)